ncbi:hypothetical protein VPH35_063496 [Triticum aestivum]
MALRQLVACMFLLLAVAVAVAVGQSPVQPQDLVGRIQASCSNTLNEVPDECAHQFTGAILSGRTVETNPITSHCCIKLACVREWACKDLLRGVCMPPEVGECSPPVVQPVSAAGTTTRNYSLPFII